MNEIVDSIKETYNRRESIIIINNLIMEIEQNPIKFTANLSLQADSIAGDDLCGSCGEELKPYTYSEDREYFGKPCKEIITEMRCIECN